MKIFSPGLLAGKAISFSRVRPVPTHGRIIVKEGDCVLDTSVVGYFNPEGSTNTYYLARELDVSPFDVPGVMLKKEGDPVKRGEVIARGRGLFSRKEFSAPEDGFIERISTYTGWVTMRGLPLPIYAGYPGTIGKILPEEGVSVRCHGTLVQGVFGIGGPISGCLEMLPVSREQVLEPLHVLPSHENGILVGGARVSLGFLARAAKLGVKAIVSGGIHKQDLDEFLGYSLGVAITGLEPTITLILTEGFGTIPMRSSILDILSNHHRQLAFASGATQVRAGVIRPELFVPTEESAKDVKTERGLSLDPGALVRIIRAPYFGCMGRVLSAPEVTMIPTESTVLAIRVEFDSGEIRLVPVANVEPIGGE